MLTEQQIERYSRQIILPQVGGRGQQRLLSAAIAVVGTGDLGTLAATYLTAAGVGRLDIIDAGAGEPGALAVAASLDTLNPDCAITARPVCCTVAVAVEVARTADVVIDASATPEISRFLNTACLALLKPMVWGAANGSIGHVSTFAGRGASAPCYSCAQALFPPAAPVSDAAAVLAGVAAAFVGSLQATQAIEIVLGMETSLCGRLLTYDALDGTVRETAIVKDPRCPVCSAPGAGVPAPSTR